MIKCRIAMVAKAYDIDVPLLILGECYDNDHRLLYELHVNLKYLYPFRGVVVKTTKNRLDIIPTNHEDFIHIQCKYKLLRNIYIPVDRPDLCGKTLTFSYPMLYDINCNVPVFSDFSERCVNKKNNRMGEYCYIFIVCPDPNPIIRGKIVDNCMKIIKNNDTYLFMTVGDKYGNNKVATSQLLNRYLITVGITNSVRYDNIPEAMTDLCRYISGNSIVYIGVRHDMMSGMLKYVRKLKYPQKIFYICE